MLKNLFIIVFLFSSNDFFSQHLVGQRSAVAQNYKLPSHTNNRFEGFSGKQLAKQEIRNKKEGEKAKKELLKSHIKKQTKATQKRMKSSLKKSKRLLRNKSLVPRWLVWWKRKKAFSQRKENKYED